MTSRKAVVLMMALMGVMAFTHALAANLSNSEASQYAVQPPATLDGQSATLLPDGTWLLLGGDIKGQVSGAAIIEDPASGQRTSLAAGLNVPRAWHTATVLPSGLVFIFGGVDATGNVITQAEYYDPASQRFSLAPAAGLTPRSHHTANVLTNGLVLFAGGAEFAPAELWDPRTNQVTAAANAMRVPRADALSTLLSTSPVLIWDGTDITGAPVASAELYVPSLDQFAPSDTGSALLPATPDLAAAPSVVDSQPSDGDKNVPVSAFIAVRFSERLQVTTLTTKTVTLIGPSGQVAATVVPAEQGMLLFVTPTQQLLPASYYTLFIRGASDPQGRALPLVTLGFETAALSAGAATSIAPATSSAGTISVVQSPLPPSVGVWQPPSSAYGGNWFMGPVTETAQANVPMLQAAPGVTALSGQALLQNGAPLPGVAVSIGNQHTVTDAAGRFLVQNISAGHVQFIVNGRTVNTATTRFGQFVIGADVQPNTTNTLDYTIWMPVIDTAHSVNIPSPTTEEVDITTPLMPGVVLKIPAGVVIREPNGNIVTNVSLTPVPVDRAPFPTPQDFPMYFVIQPGGAYLESVNGEQGVGATIVYPNSRNLPTSTPVNYLYYDPGSSNWLAYGHGKVFPQSGMIEADRKVNVPIFTAFSYTGGTQPPPSVVPPPGDCREGRVGDPVDCYTGLFIYNHVDMVLPDTIPIVISRTYLSSDAYGRNFGIGFAHPYNLFLYTSVGESATNFQTLNLVQADGSQIVYTRTASSSQTGLAGLQMSSAPTPTSFYGSMITYDGTYLVLTTKDGTLYKFATVTGRALREIINRNGQTLQLIAYVGSEEPIETMTSPNGHWVTFQYQSLNYPGTTRVTQITDDSGRSVNYAYDSSGRLIKVTYPDGGIEQYTYNGVTDEIASIILPNGQTQVTNTYDSNGRVTKQVLADTGTYQFAYVTNSSNQVTQTTITDPNGNVRVLNFNSSGYITSETQASGTSIAQTATYTRDPSSNLITSVTDALNRVSNYSYNSLGNLTGVTLLAGTSNAVSYALTYTASFNELASLTDPLNHKTTLSYDSYGDLTSIKNPLNHSVTLAYNTATGQPTKITDALGHAITLAYTGGDLTSVTDALGRKTTRYLDSVGRVISLLDPLGNRSLYSYDPMNRVTSITDGLGATTTLGYDLDGNLTSVTDARSGLTQFGYDTSDRETSRTDALGQKESFGYDLDNNLTGHTDRKNQSRVLSYDALNRLTQVTYKKTGGATESTVTYGYDAGNRETSINDSVGGSLTENYDGLNRLTSETSTNGSVSYQYDAASRRTQMTVAGQTAVNYGYDNADRLTGITQGSSSVAISYDNANRRATLTLPNGIQLTYGFDNANQLTGLTYKLGASTVGNMTYGYDNDGRIATRGGSFDVTNLPATLASASYDANNRLTQWGAKTLSYDNNGNLTGDGTNSYTWNTRNQLTGISGGSTASFVYDALGRRESKTISSTSTNFLYDGLNLEQELNGTTPTVNYLTGAGIDETLSRTDSTGTFSYLTDNLGSTLALTNTAGAISTSYSYEPYGNTTDSGVSSTNALQYTGRENDGDGLYYNYFRYYDPTIGRFISSDPIGLAGGINTYTYALDNPVGYADPSGLAVYVGEHGGFFSGDPFQHTAIVLEPDNPADFNFPNNMYILGAQPFGGSPNLLSPFYRYLQSEPNYPGDSPGTTCQPGPLQNLTAVPTPSGMTDTQFINALLKAANSYQNSSPYLPFPYGPYYNSNSYTAGVIIAAGGTPPPLPGIQPGYGHPLPLP
ncbi:MAG: RHS repeat-associated core domain-containing protein [Gammaproteobacteria bacterium]